MSAWRRARRAPFRAEVPAVERAERQCCQLQRQLEPNAHVGLVDVQAANVGPVDVGEEGELVRHARDAAGAIGARPTSPIAARSTGTNYFDLKK